MDRSQHGSPRNQKSLRERAAHDSNHSALRDSRAYSCAATHFNLRTRLDAQGRKRLSAETAALYLRTVSGFLADFVAAYPGSIDQNLLKHGTAALRQRFAQLAGDARGSPQRSALRQRYAKERTALLKEWVPVAATERLLPGYAILLRAVLPRTPEGGWHEMPCLPSLAIWRIRCAGEARKNSQRLRWRIGFAYCKWVWENYAEKFSVDQADSPRATRSLENQIRRRVDERIPRFVHDFTGSLVRGREKSAVEVDTILRCSFVPFLFRVQAARHPADKLRGRPACSPLGAFFLEDVMRSGIGGARIGRDTAVNYLAAVERLSAHVIPNTRAKPVPEKFYDREQRAVDRLRRGQAAPKSTVTGVLVGAPICAACVAKHLLISEGWDVAKGRQFLLGVSRFYDWMSSRRLCSIDGSRFRDLVASSDGKLA